jgi:hypothetical protein
MLKFFYLTNERLLMIFLFLSAGCATETSLRILPFPWCYLALIFTTWNPILLFFEMKQRIHESKGTYTERTFKKILFTSFVMFYIFFLSWCTSKAVTWHHIRSMDIEGKCSMSLVNSTFSLDIHSHVAVPLFITFMILLIDQIFSDALQKKGGIMYGLIYCLLSSYLGYYVFLLYLMHKFYIFCYLMYKKKNIIINATKIVPRLVLCIFSTVPAVEKICWYKKVLDKLVSIEPSKKQLDIKFSSFYLRETKNHGFILLKTDYFSITADAKLEFCQDGKIKFTFGSFGAISHNTELVPQKMKENTSAKDIYQYLQRFENTTKLWSCIDLLDYFVDEFEK